MTELSDELLVAYVDGQLARKPERYGFCRFQNFGRRLDTLYCSWMHAKDLHQEAE